MAAKASKSVVLKFIFLLILNFNGLLGSKLNVPKLLLPYYSQTAANFTLEVSDGCFTWYSSRPEIASVRPLGTKDLSACSRTAVVTAVSSIPTRRTAIITAVDLATSQQLRCDVIIDEIKQIHIETTTKELFLDDSPEEYIVRASNDKDDMFSSIEGMIFEWSLISDKSSGEQASNVLRLMKFSESSYTALPHIKFLEDQGKRGDRILMKSLQTGAAIVSVKAADPAYKHLQEHQVRVLVVANLQLTPSVVYVLPHAVVTYKVELLKQGKAEEVKMPSKQYYLEVESPAIASLDPKTSSVTALKYGVSEVKLKDQTVRPSDSFREPSASVYVVIPAYLGFTITPDSNWLLETNRTYIVCINAFDAESRKIFPSENLRITANFPENLFRVIFSTTNGTYFVVETLRKGFTTITAQMKSVLRSDGKEFDFNKPVDGIQNVEIFDPIQLVPESVVLPLKASRDTVQFNFRVSGGSGNYTWHSSDPSVADVSSSGTTFAGSVIGSTIVRASDVRNLAHFDESKVFVVPPTKLVFLPSPVEAEIGSQLILPIALYGTLDDANATFDECYMLAFEVHLSDFSIFQKIAVQKSTHKGACADLVLEATSGGYVTTTVSYEVDKLHLIATQVIGAYSPLKPFWPKEVVITVGSSLDVVFEGGPNPWVLDASGFFHDAVVDAASISANEPYISDESKRHHSVEVRCLKIGEKILKLIVGNKATAKNLFPASSTAEVSIACEIPKGLQLFPAIEHSTDISRCPISPEFDDPVPVPLQTNVQMIAVLTDRLGRKFNNFSSLIVDWKMSNLSLGKFLDQDRTERKDPKSSTDHRWISIGNESGLLTVTVEIKRHEGSSAGNWFGDSSINPPIVKSRELQLVGYPRFSHDQVAMFNHHESKTSINISQGSGYFKIDQSEDVSKIARVIYNKDDDDHVKNISVVPLNEGSMMLTVTDLCLSPVETANVEIFVSDIATIDLLVVDKVELHREVMASVRILDGNKRPIESRYFYLMKIQLVARSDFISVSPSTANDSKNQTTTAFHTVRGNALGRAYLQASAVAKTGRIISSAVKEIQVFPPLRLEPKNIAIIPGTYFQVTAFGGPQPESTIEFKIKNPAIATVTKDGVVNALSLGTTEIIAMAMGLDANNNSRIAFSQDSAIVDVIELTAVRIVVPLKRILAGNKMPVYAVGHSENVTPFSFANVVPPLEFRWIVANNRVAILRPVFHESGIDVTDEGNFAVRFHALSSGQVTLKLVVKGHRSESSLMTDSVVIQVFDRLSFLSPPIHDGSILMMPNTELYVVTNRHGSTAQLSYAVVESPHTSVQQAPSIAVSQNGLLSAGEYQGEAYLRITALEEFGVNHSMVVLVKVKPLSYIMFNTVTVLCTRFPGLSAFPVGTTINFVVSLHDDVGEKFDASQSNLRFHLNKHEQIQVLYGKTNNSLSVKASSPGFTAIKVFEKLNPTFVDYIGIPVDSAIYPSQIQVMLGSIVCFGSNLLTREGHIGEWSSSENRVTIDRVSGISVADLVGSFQIVYNVSYVITQAIMTVVPIANVVLRDAVSLPFLTNVEDLFLSDPLFQVVLENFDHGCKAGIQGANCSERIRSGGLENLHFLPFSCSMSFTDDTLEPEISSILSIAPTFDPLAGKHSCRVRIIPSPNLVPVVASFETSVKVLATVLAQDGQASIISNELVIPFHPAFYIENPEIVLSIVKPVVSLEIVATEAVLGAIQIVSSDESIVRVRLHHRSSVTYQKVIRFPLELQLSSRLWNIAPTTVNVTVHCVLTGQSQVVVVSILKIDQAEIGWRHSLRDVLLKYSYTFVIILVVIVCLFFAYNLIRGPDYRRSGADANSSAASASFLSSSEPRSPFAPAYGPRPSPPLWSKDRSPYSAFRYRSSRGSPLS